LRLRFLGTGTSFGIPVVGCDCATCRSDDVRDRRTRHGAIIESANGDRLLVDTPPELRLQLLDARIDHVDAIWFTHAHADHVHGIDDVRVFSAHGSSVLPAYANMETADALRSRFTYIFDRDYRPPDGTTRPEIELRGITGNDVVHVGSLRILPVEVLHGDLAVLGFRVGSLGYITDAKSIPPEARRRLEGVKVLVLNALWSGHPHPTHFNVEEAVEVAREIGAERTFLTHLTHRVRHAQLSASLPPGVQPAYDGLTLDLEDDPS
jgi:phosphoribosyl 1,2-cyclic phosphate phosphodiesterase